MKLCSHAGRYDSRKNAEYYANSMRSQLPSGWEVDVEPAECYDVFITRPQLEVEDHD